MDLYQKVYQKKILSFVDFFVFPPVSPCFFFTISWFYGTILNIHPLKSDLLWLVGLYKVFFPSRCSIDREPFLISLARRNSIPPAPRFSSGKLLWRRTCGEKNTVLCTVFFSLSKIWFFFVHSTEASQSSVLLRTEENPNRKNWRRVRQFFLLSDW